MAIRAVTHVGVCVADLERSLRFYVEGLGFEPRGQFSVSGPAWGRVMEVADLDVRSCILRRDSVAIELLCYDSPGHLGAGERRPMNELGLTHLAVWVDDLDVEMARLRDYGADVVETTLTAFDEPGLQARWVYCTDPDGVRIELIEHATWQPAALQGRPPD